jgi:hypothetical protein
MAYLAARTHGVIARCSSTSSVSMTSASTISNRLEAISSVVNPFWIPSKIGLPRPS